jgi:hypothetical protein
VLPLQRAPVPAAHSAGGAAHEQLAVGCAPLHGLPDGHVVFPGATATQPSASSTQVATVVPDSQNEPAPPAHAAGRVGQAQVASGADP